MNKRVYVYFTLLTMLLLLLSACDQPTNPQAKARNQVTIAQFNQIKTTVVPPGMTLPQVNKIMGFDGKKFGITALGTASVQYIWKDSSDQSKFIIVTFRNGRAVSKTKSGI